jgi:hypothetical protein
MIQWHRADMLKQSILMLCCTLASVHLLSASTYYANSGTGNDSADGSSGTPWLTLYTSIPKLSAGDTLIATGTFSEAVGYGSDRTVASSGTAGNPTTVLASNATINIQDNGSDRAGIYYFTGDYLTIDGFTFTSTLTNQGVFMGGFFTFAGSHCTAQNFVVTNAYGAHLTNAGGGDHLMVFQSNGDNNTFSNIFFHEINDADLFRVHAKNNLFTHIIVSNCFNPYYDADGQQKLHADFIQTGLYQGDADTRSNIVECCLFINPDSARYSLSIEGGVYTSAYGAQNTTNPVWWSHWTFRNNVFINWSAWFSMYNYTNHFYNNVFFESGHATYNHIIYCGLGGGYGAGSMMKNNVFIGSGVNTESTCEVSYNGMDSAARGYMQYTNNWSPSVSNATVTLAQMGFVNATNYPYDFHLTAGSVLRGAGVNLSSDLSASTTDRDGKARPSGGAWDLGPYQYAAAGPVTNAAIQVSPSTLAFGSLLTNTAATNFFIVQNAGGGTLSGTASVPAPFYIVGGGAYTLGSNQSQTVTVRYSASGLNDSQVVTFTGGDGATATVSGSLLAIQSGLSFESYAGTITGPFSTNGGYVSQSVQTTSVTSGGSATYFFNITNAGQYIIEASVLAQDSGSKSLWVNMDAMPVDPAMIWDIYPYSTNFQTVPVSWRGNSTTITNDQYNPNKFNLTSGVHELIIIGREANVRLGQITIAPFALAPYLVDSPTAPSPPPNLRVIASAP